MEINRLISLIIAIIGMMAFFVAETTFMQFCILLVVLFAGLTYFRFNILYPFTWLAPVLVLYNISLYLVELAGYITLPYFPIILKSLFISLSTIFLYCFFFIKEREVETIENGFLNEKRAKVIKYVLFGLGLYLLLCIPLFLVSGFTSKIDMNYHGGLFGFGIVSRWFVLLYTIILIYEFSQKQQFPILLTSASLLLSLALSLVIGERDVVLSIGLSTVFVYSFFRKMQVWKLLAIVFVGLVSVSVLGELKQVTNQEEITIGENDFVVSVFGGEFATSTNNFETLLENRGIWEFENGEGFIRDVAHSIIPSFLYHVDTASQWYNKKFNLRFSDGYGAGFSLLAEGYLQWGYFGVFFISVFLMIIIHALYFFSNRTIYGLASYIFMVSLIAYAMRGDMSFVISPLIKQVLFSYVIIRIFLYLFRL